MARVKLGACDWALPGNGQYATRIAHDVGLQALSLRLGLKENDYPLTRATMQNIYLDEQQRWGIEYVAVALNDFDNIPMHASLGSEHYETVWRLLAKAPSTAKALGASIIQVPAFGASAITNEEEMERAAAALRHLCGEAGEQDLSVASENILSSEDFEELYERVGSDNFYLYFDSQNYYLNHGWDEVEILTKLYPLMCDQLHVKDGAGHLSGSLLGEGDSGFVETMAWLDRHDYRGYILLENYYDVWPLREVMDDPYDILRRDVEILKETVERWSK